MPVEATILWDSPYGGVRLTEALRFRNSVGRLLLRQCPNACKFFHLAMVHVENL